MTYTYEVFPLQLVIVPLLLIVLQQYNKIRELYFLLLFSTLIGFSYYYFWPTIGPASSYINEDFTSAQFATGIKFHQIHHKIPPTTLEGGLIAMPSFHIIWAWYCQYSCFKWKWVFWPLLIINLMLSTSCIILGWHYFVDLVGSMIVIICSHILLNRITTSNSYSLA